MKNTQCFIFPASGCAMIWNIAALQYGCIPVGAQVEGKEAELAVCRSHLQQLTRILNFEFWISQVKKTYSSALSFWVPDARWSEIMPRCSIFEPCWCAGGGEGVGAGCVPESPAAAHQGAQVLGSWELSSQVRCCVGSLIDSFIWAFSTLYNRTRGS